MSYSTLVLGVQDQIATITLNRPEKRNAISPEMLLDIPAALAEVAAGPARVAILTGAGSAFCAGMDLEALRAMASQSPADQYQEVRRMVGMFQSVYAFPKPLIAAVNGPAIAGGTGLATLADFTLAVPAAKFGYTEVKIGFLPAAVSVFLIRQVGEKRARELLLTGRIFGTEEALAAGLVTRSVPAETLMEEARALAESLVALSPTSLAATKRILLQWHHDDVERDLEVAIRESVAIRSTPDFREGLTAFLEKRPPKWSGQ